MNINKNYLLFWQERFVLDYVDNNLPLNVIASSQLYDVSPGETIWVVTLNQENELFLVGRLVVREIVGYEEAITRIQSTDLGHEEYYAFPEENTVEFLQRIPLRNVTSRLRFIDPNNDRLTTINKTVNSLELTLLRHLTDQSADIIRGIWEGREIRNLESSENPEDLIAFYSAEIEKDPNDFMPYFNLSVALEDSGYFEDSLRELRHSIELNPNFAPAQFNLGSSLLRVGSFDQSIEAFNAAVISDYEFSPAHFMLGVAYAQNREFEKAIYATRKGLEVSPDDPLAYFNLGKAYYDLGRFDQSLEVLEGSVALDNDFADAYYLQGRCYRALGDSEKEMDSYRKVLDLMPDHVDAIFSLGTAWSNERVAASERNGYLETHGLFDVENPEHQFYLGLGFLALGFSVLATEQIEKLEKIDMKLARRLSQFLVDFES